MDIPNKTGINIKSYELKEICDNTELDEEDNPNPQITLQKY